jgi:hypothetical protein
MVIKEQDRKRVDQNYLDDKFRGRCVLLLFNGEKLPMGEGYLAYTSNATSLVERSADTRELMRLLVEEHNSDGIISSGDTGGELLFIH